MISGHVNFVDLSEVNLTSPLWVSMVRDPVRRYVSAFDFARTATSDVYNSRKLYDNLLNEGSLRVRNLTYDQWMGMDMNECVASQHPDCELREGEWNMRGKGDTQVVRMMMILSRRLAYMCK